LQLTPVQTLSMHFRAATLGLLLRLCSVSARLYARALVQNDQFVWSEFSELNPVTGNKTSVVESGFVLGREQSIEGVAAYDWGSQSFVFADDTAFDSCEVVDVAIKSANFGPPHPSAGPSFHILLNGVSAIVSAGKAGGVFVFGVVVKQLNATQILKEPVLRKLVGRGRNTSIELLTLPREVPAAPQVNPAFEEAAGKLHMVTTVLGSNLTRVSALDVSAPAPIATTSTFTCHDQLPWSFPSAIPTKAAALERGMPPRLA
jgi:hypothetical protein